MKARLKRMLPLLIVLSLLLVGCVAAPAPAPAPQQEEAAEEAAEEPTNPFAALRARAVENGNAPEPATNSRRSFTPRRIDPADVPPGMRVVSTPFGDRLVPE